MKKIRLCKADLISALLCMAIMIPGISVYNKLPDRIATNFGLNGQPQQYASKNFTVFGIPLLMTAIQLLLCIITNLFHQTGTRDIINRAIRFVFPAVYYVAQFSLLLYALGQIKNPASVACTFMAVLFVVMGNYMPKIRRNMFLGIRTPHTLLNQEVWDKTHRFSGALFILCGIVMLPFSLAGNYIAVGIILAIKMIMPAVYSEMIYRAERSNMHEP